MPYNIFSRLRARRSLAFFRARWRTPFHSPQTGTFGHNIASMFGQSDPDRQGILNTLLASGGAGVLSKLGLGSTVSQVTPEQAQQIPPQAVELAAEHAQTRPFGGGAGQRILFAAPAVGPSLRRWGGVAGDAAFLPCVRKGPPRLEMINRAVIPDFQSETAEKEQEWETRVARKTRKKNKQQQLTKQKQGEQKKQDKAPAKRPLTGTA